MEIIVITAPEPIPDEIKIIHQLFDAGLNKLHMRRPGITEGELYNWIQKIEDIHQKKIVIHHHHQLAKEMKIGGFHLREAERIKAEAQKWKQWERLVNDNQLTMSTSVHLPSTLNELTSLFDYVWVSPIYDSISKPGYHQNNDWTDAVIQQPYPFDLVALGGITPELMPELVGRGFRKAAMLGAIWQRPENAVSVFNQTKIPN